jgi:transposase-like protein
VAYVWIKTTKDKYEFIVAMGDTVKALARECGTTENTIYSAISHARKKGKSSIYKKVVLEE